MPERLQKILSRAGIASRRQAEKMILAGEVSVNGQVISDLGFQSSPQEAKILVRGKPVFIQASHHYYLYYKPRGLVVSKKDELGREGIFDRLKLPPAVNAVGRLDKDSEGLLLLSDDGDFVYRYTHPKFEVPKLYQVSLSRPLKAGEDKELLRGFLLDGKKASVRRLEVLETKKPGAWVGLELIEGRKREIRRLMEILGIKVERLIRVAHGNFVLGALRPGEIKKLAPEDTRARIGF